MDINGFYSGYMTGAGGNGVALFILRDGVLIGCDMGGVKFDGNYAPADTGGYIGTTTVTVPAGVTVVQGLTAPPSGMKYDVELKLPATFLEDPFFEIVTPIGKVNARLQKMRDL